MIVDFHTHTFAPSVVVRAMAVLSRRTEGNLTPAADGTLSGHLDFMERAGIDRAVLCPIATKPGHFDVIMRRARAILSGEAGERAQRRIVPFASVHPADPDCLRHLEEVARAGLRGVKFHPYYQDFSLADPAIRPMFRKIAELGLLVECHAGEDIGYPGRRDACGPEDVATLLENVPGLTFVAAHLGGCVGFPSHATDRLLELGAYVDTSVLARDWMRDEPMRLLRSWPRERILFATDFPWVHYPEALAWVRSVRVREDWEPLFGGNAARLLGL